MAEDRTGPFRGAVAAATASYSSDTSPGIARSGASGVAPEPLERPDAGRGVCLERGQQREVGVLERLTQARHLGERNVARVRVGAAETAQPPDGSGHVVGRGA
jgi:hypothetical protein